MWIGIWQYSCVTVTFKISLSKDKKLELLIWELDKLYPSKAKRDNSSDEERKIEIFQKPLGLKSKRRVEETHSLETHSSWIHDSIWIYWIWREC